MAKNYSRYKVQFQRKSCVLPPPPNKTVCLPDSNGSGPAFSVAKHRSGDRNLLLRYDPSRYSPDDGSTGFTILTCMTFNRRCTQIHVLFQRVKTERGMCRACCEGIQTPNAIDKRQLISSALNTCNTLKHTHTHTRALTS